MLNPETDRINYGENIFSPPKGYELDFAVGTTYSLDLQALTSACLAFGVSKDMEDEKLSKDEVSIFHSFNKVKDKVAVFCQNGQIQLHRAPTPLYCLLDTMVFPVTIGEETNKVYPSFHSKIWVIKYQNKQNKKEKKYRAAVLSRNLTFDKSWDVAYYMDSESEKTDNIVDKNKNIPLCAFLEYLKNKTPDGHNHKNNIDTLKDELINVVFKAKDDYDFEFFPAGINGYTIWDKEPFKKSDEQNKESFDELIVISPFLSKNVIKDFNEKAPENKAKLITREHSLKRLDRDSVSNFDIYTLRDDLILNENNNEEEQQEGNNCATGTAEDSNNQTKTNEEILLNNDIHAKIYITKKGEENKLYLGSVNASENALYHNVEFMICLKNKNVFDIEKELFEKLNDDENDEDLKYLKKVSKDDISVDEEQKDEEDKSYDLIFKELSQSNPRAEVSDEKPYTITIHFEQWENKYGKEKEITISPLFLPSQSKQIEIKKSVNFENIEEEYNISEFYKITVKGNDEKTESKIFVIPTEKIPKDREKTVIQKIFSDDKYNKLYQYMSFWLEDDNIISIFEKSSSESSDGNPSNGRYKKINAIYEKMLKLAGSNPEKFKELDNIMKSIKLNDNTDDKEYKNFVELCSTFIEAVNEH